MQCEAFEHRLNQLLDRRRAPEGDSSLLAHAQGCRSCRQLLDGQRLLLDSLAYGDTPSPSANDLAPDFASAVVRRYERHQVGQRRRRTWRVVGTLAAAVLIAVSAAAWRVRYGNANRVSVRQANSQLAANNAATGASTRGTTKHGQRNRQIGVLAIAGAPRQSMRGTQVVAPAEQNAAEENKSAEPNSSVDSSAQMARAAVAEFAAADEALRSLPYQRWLAALQQEPAEYFGVRNERDQYVMMFDDWRMHIAEMPAEPLEVDQIAGGLEPLTQPFGVAFDLLWQALPSGQPPVEKPQAQRPADTTRRQIG